MYMQICICVCIYICVDEWMYIYIQYIFMCMYMYAYVVYVLFSIFPSFSLSFLNFFSKMLIIFFHKGNFIFILICLFLSSFYFYYFCYMLVFLSCLFQLVILMLFYINMFCLKSSAPHGLVSKCMYTQNCKNYNTVSIICIF